jgi:hypothetical protein
MTSKSITYIFSVVRNSMKLRNAVNKYEAAKYIKSTLDLEFNEKWCVVITDNNSGKVCFSLPESKFIQFICNGWLYYVFK